MNPKLRAFYKFGPIMDLATLSQALNISEIALIALVAKAEKLYRPVSTIKKDGSVRMTWDANPALKAVHQRIMTRILTRVLYPSYLQGGIRDPNNPRDYARNADIHTRQACVINEDVKNFFPSITAAQVFDIWHCFFRFSGPVSEALTSLTTLDGKLPQGAKTSSYLANLVFWRSEPELVQHLQLKGLRYSRFVDDITISSRRRLDDNDKTELIAVVYGFLRRSGFRPKHTKHQIFSAATRMLVNGLVVNSRAALPSEERNRIRLVVYRATNSYLPNAAEPSRTVRHVRGKIAKLSRFHPLAARRMKAMMS